MPRKRDGGVDPRYRTARPEPVIPLPNAPTQAMVDAAMTAARQAGGPANAYNYAFLALREHFADPDRVARKMGVRRPALMLGRADAFARSKDCDARVMVYVRQRLDGVIAAWRAEQRKAADRKARIAAEKADARKAAAAQARKAVQDALDAEARADHARREAVRAAAACLADAAQQSCIVPRIYKPMPPPDGPGRGLRTAKPRADWWSEGEAARVPSGRHVMVEAGMPPKGRSALDQRQRGEA